MDTYVQMWITSTCLDIIVENMGKNKKAKVI